MKGWVSIHREILSHWIWNKRPYSYGQAWIDLLLKANHQENKTVVGSKLITIEKGSFITSEVKLSKQWGWSRRKIRMFFDLLISDKMLSKNATSNYTTLTIVNYDSYQDLGTAKEQQKNSKRTAKEQQKNTNNNDNNENKENKKEIYKEICKFFLDKDFQEVWIKWLEYRIEIRHPLKDSTIESQLKMLGAYSKEKAIMTIEKSIQNGWQGLFPEKANGISNRTTPIKSEELEDTKAEFIKMGFQHL